MQVGRSLLLLAFLASLSPSLRENAAQHSVNAWVQIAVSYSAITLLGWEMILVRGCENVAGKLSQRWLATAGTNFTKPRASYKWPPSLSFVNTLVIE